jgi:Protein of unknown function (DUF1493).
MYSQEQINNFIKEKTGIDELKPGDDLMNDHGVCGDDFDELIDGYAKAFNVDISGYLWYFHTDEEGSWNSIGGSLFKPPNERVPHIPLTPALLLEMANKGYWDVQYPHHKLPKFRWDIIMNLVLLVSAIVYALYSCLK